MTKEPTRDRGAWGHAATEPIWARPEPRTRRPRHSRAQIADAALRIADTEGIDAVSMRRVAADLGAGTMTLYHYVRTKSDLLALMEDAIMAELVVPELPPGWRAGLTAIAHRTRDTFRRHPWAVAGMRGHGMSPHALRHFEQALAAVADTGLDPVGRLDLIAMIDEYVAGFAHKNAEADLTSLSAPAIGAVEEYLGAQLATGRYPRTAALLGGTDRLGRLVRLAGGLSEDERFARGLARLLDGVAAELA